MRPPPALRFGVAVLLTACGSRTPLFEETTVPDAAPTIDAGCSTPGVVTLVTRPRSTWFGDSMAVDGTSLYWLEHGDLMDGPGSLMRMSKCGGAPERLATTSNYPGRVVVDATHAYWTSQAAAGTGGVRSVPLAGGAPTLIAPDGNDTGVAVDATYVYWIDHGSTVMRAPKTGGAAVVFASGPFPWDSVAVNASRVVWTNQPAMGWLLTEMSVAGGPVTTLDSAATGNVGTWAGLAIDDDRAYWAAYGPGYGASGVLWSAPLDPRRAGRSRSPPDIPPR